MRISDAVLQNLRAVVELPAIEGGRYEILEKIGSGGMGTVFRANDLELKREVAVKVMDFSDKDADLADRMIREAQTIARLEHPGIVPIHDVGKLADGRIFYAMKLVRGERLDQNFVKTKPLNEKLRVFQRVCEALAFAHAQNVIHRDVKPENIMIGAYGEVLLMDWGLAKLRGAPSAPCHEDQASAIIQTAASKTENQTLHGQVLGTPDYMSPEQAQGRVELIDHRSDIFALGGVLRFLVGSGKNSSDYSNRKSSLRFKFENFFSRPPKPLVAIYRKALEAKKERRYDAALKISEDVEAFLSGQPVSAYKENVFEALLRWSKQNKFILILVSVYILSRLLLAFFLQN